MNAILVHLSHGGQPEQLLFLNTRALYSYY